MTTDKTPATLATVDASYTTGHCAHNNRLGGCHLHNLQCGWPACDRRPAKPSLATAKHGGEVQLGDWLLPCPFCGERAERIDFGPGSGDNEGGSCVACTVCQHSAPVEFGYKENLISNWNRRARSAQPSPGGQGDALTMIGANLRSVMRLCRPEDYSISRLDAANIHMEARHALQLLEAALASRQPVGEPVAFDYPEFHAEGMGCGLEDRNITDRYEAMRYGFDEALDQMASILDSIGPLYAAPPADLVQVIEQIAQQWDGCNYDAVGETIDVGQAIRAAGKRLADSQSVREPVGYFDPDVLAHLTEGLIDPVGVLRRKPNGKSNVPVWLTPPSQAVDLGEMPEGWRLSKLANCYQLSHGNDIIGNLVGPDAEENAAIIARVLDSQAARTA